MKRIFFAYTKIKLFFIKTIMNNARLFAKHLTKTFTYDTKTIIVLDNIQKIFMQGKTYAITGQSGVGKSTLLHLLAGLDTPTTGDVFFNDKSFNNTSAQERAFLQTKIGLVFQTPHLMKELSVIENICLPGFIANKDINYIKNYAQELLTIVGLADKTHAKPGELSGGQQQRVVLARALINTPSFLLADEPTGNLDIKTGKKIIELLLSCCIKKNIGIIVSSHDPYVTDAMGEKCTLSNGTLQSN